MTHADHVPPPLVGRGDHAAIIAPYHPAVCREIGMDGILDIVFSCDQVIFHIGYADAGIQSDRGGDRDGCRDKYGRSSGSIPNRAVAAYYSFVL